MGWLFYTDPSRVLGHAGEKAEFARLTTHKGDDVAYEPLQLSKVGSTWYVAVRKRPLNGVPIAQDHFVTAEDGSFVFAAVFFVRYDQGCFGYKDMDETMGPNEARAPISLIKKLSPLAPASGESDPCAYARAWRARCAAFAGIPDYKAGDVIALGTPIQLKDGTEIRTVRKTAYVSRGKTRSTYVDVETGKTWALKRVHLAGSSLVSSAAGEASPVLAEFADRQREAP